MAKHRYTLEIDDRLEDRLSELKFSTKSKDNGEIIRKALLFFSVLERSSRHNKEVNESFIDLMDKIKRYNTLGTSEG